MKIDFGSGYNPKEGYSTCDITTSPFLDFISYDNKIYSREGEVKENTVDKIRCRNVLHHVKDLQALLTNFYRYLKIGGELEIIDCAKEFYPQNVILDNIWYRWFDDGKRGVWYSTEYRSFIPYLQKIGFVIKEHKIINEKENFLCEKIIL